MAPRTCGSVMAGVFFFRPPSLDGQEPSGQQAERHVVLPAHPVANLIIRQARLSLTSSNRPESTSHSRSNSALRRSIEPSLALSTESSNRPLP